MDEPNPYESPRANDSHSDASAEEERSLELPLKGVKTLELWGVLAFGLVVFLPFSGLGSILAMLVAEQQIALVVLLTSATYAAVLIPTILSWRRHLQSPKRWRGRGYLDAATILLGLHAALSIVGLLGMVLR